MAPNMICGSAAYPLRSSSPSSCGSLACRTRGTAPIEPVTSNSTAIASDLGCSAQSRLSRIVTPNGSSAGCTRAAPPSL